MTLERLKEIIYDWEHNKEVRLTLKEIDYFGEFDEHTPVGILAYQILKKRKMELIENIIV